MVVKELMRFAHSDGHVDLCFDETGQRLITCGSDGDVRIYKGFDDEDNVSHSAGDIVYAVAQRGSQIFVAADDNAVQSYMIENGDPNGLIVRFTAHATHIVVSQSGKILVAGSSDFLIKIVDLESKSHRTVSGHSAPVLSLALHPKDQFLASSSCDGTVRVVRLDDLKEVKVIAGLLKSNDFLTSKTLSRLSFDKKGNFLFVPFEKSVKAFECKSWSEAYELNDDTIQQVVSIVAVSSCGKYLAAATRDGKIVVWDTTKRTVILRESHEKNRSITALVWNPQRFDLAYADNFGYIGLLKDVVAGSIPASTDAHQNEVDFQTASDLFDDDNDGLEDAFAGEIPGVDGDFDADYNDDDGSSITSIQKPSVNPAVRDDDNMDAESTASAKPAVTSVANSSWRPTALQKPFQPSSCPVNVSTRFMTWNSVGIVTQYSTEEEESIDVEFHDTATHHAIHVNNTIGHTMADLSAEAVLLAAEAEEDNPSQLVCMHFGSWDSCTEWNVVMPVGEDILAVCLGNGWLAVVTDQRLVRIFSIGGLQKRIFRLPGPVVAMAAHMDSLFLVYHGGLGVTGDQCLSFYLLDLSSKKCLCSDRLPLSTKSTLAWIGFSGEGTAFAVDSSGVVQMLSRIYCNTWSVVANLRDHCKGASDNYWVVGIRENPQQLRAILCKGAKYPSILPKPTVQLIPFQIPVCELKADKGMLEEQFMRTAIFSEHLSCWLAGGFEVEESETQKLQMLEQELLMKQFALACKMKREFRAVEVCQMMSSSRAVQLAVKYATKVGLMEVARRLNDVARQKAEEESASNFDSAIALDDGNRVDISSRIYSKSKSRISSIVRSRDSDDDNCGGNGEAEIDEDDDDNDNHETNDNNNIKTNGTTSRLLPLRRNSDDKEKTKSLSSSQSSTSNKNPFKKSSTAPTIASDQPKGTRLFDNLEMSKTGRVSFGTNSKLKSDGPSSDLKKKSSQIRVSDLLKPLAANQTKDAGKTDEKIGSSVTGFQLWFEDNRDCLLDEFPNMNEDELTIKAAKKFKQLTKDEQKEWQTKAACSGEKNTERKRKQLDSEADKEDDDDDTEAGSSMEPSSKKMRDAKSDNTKTQLKGTNKLTAFCFSKSS